ncbi:Hypothetical predicted protein [Mytilus galloprovincialis]|uniref:Uncharacterized protein n=1 Tax=Mytilus galloprovincialis TaxID=29158 RepID=A0A8B6CN09_MYTGA|nr:Hypothetical predicted protein [Mytilus galloprovincialis]
MTLQTNPITTLEANVFKELTTLEVLILHDNQISTVDANAFSDLTALRGVTLHNNHITTIDVNVLNGLTALIYVEISDNPLKCTNCEMKQLRMLLERLVYGNLTSAICDGGTLLADYDFDDCTGVSELTTKTTTRPTTIVTTTRPDLTSTS